MATGREVITSVECLGEIDDYVYDISMRFGDPIFYANGIAVHNTDSVYFTAMPAMPEDTVMDLDDAVKLYDHISHTVSDTFPEFLKKTFNVPLSAGAVLKAGREVVGRSGLFITKKRYAIKCLDIEEYRPEGGKLKIMGMDIKRSDTPEFIQEFLEGILDDALSGSAEEDIIQQIRDFKQQFQSLESWKKGMPKRVNNLTHYTEILKNSRKNENMRLVKLHSIKDEDSSTIPGHVRASINWNDLKSAFTDNYSMTIMDGMKVIVCRLKNNPMGYTSIAYPTDELHLPQWFKELPFDDEGMEEAVLDKKIENVLGAMGWDLSRSKDSAALEEFFSF